jgi:hypothetical protein
LLYDKRYKGERGWINISTLLDTEDLQHFLTNQELMNTLMADIDYLSEGGFIARSVQPHDGLVKIQQKGVDLVDAILDQYPRYLENTLDSDLHYRGQTILGSPEGYPRSSIAYFHIKQTPAVFKSFLQSSKIFERILSGLYLQDVIESNLSQWTEAISWCIIKYWIVAFTFYSVPDKTLL